MLSIEFNWLHLRAIEITYRGFTLHRLLEGGFEVVTLIDPYSLMTCSRKCHARVSLLS